MGDICLGQSSLIKIEADGTVMANSTFFLSVLCSYLSERLPQESLERENITQHKEQPEEEERGRVHGPFPPSQPVLTQQHQELRNKTKEKFTNYRFCIYVEDSKQIGLGKTGNIYP